MTTSPQSAGELLTERQINGWREILLHDYMADDAICDPVNRVQINALCDLAIAHLSQASERSDGVMDVTEDMVRAGMEYQLREGKAWTFAGTFKAMLSAAPAASVSADEKIYTKKDAEVLCSIAVAAALKGADARDAEALQEELTHERQCVARFSQLLERAVRVVDAARGILRDTDYCRGMPDDMPSKGTGNFLADAIVAYDAAMEKK